MPTRESTKSALTPLEFALDGKKAPLIGGSRMLFRWVNPAHSGAIFADTRINKKRPNPFGIRVHHSYRGSQYVDTRLIALLEDTGVARSMSRAGNCYDNAMIESFWSSLKTETQMDILPPLTRQEAKLAIFDYIETFYNSTRRHSSLGYLSPVAFEKQKLNHTIAA